MNQMSYPTGKMKSILANGSEKAKSNRSPRLTSSEEDSDVNAD